VWYEPDVSGIPTVAFDVTPLVGFPTGIGNAVSSTFTALSALADGPTLLPYALGLRTRRHAGSLPRGARFVPVPTRALLTAWSHLDWPRLDARLRPATVVHATNYVVPPSRLRTVATVYDTTYVRFPELVTPVVRQFGAIVRRAVARGAVLHTGAYSVAEELDELYGPGLLAAGRIVVVPFGVPDIGEPVAMPSHLAATIRGAPFVLALGTIEPRKQLPSLVRAFGALASRVPEVALVVAGPDGPDRPTLDAAIAASPPEVRARIAIVGAVTSAERRALLGAASVLAYPSRYEGFGFPILEAMAAATPVVATATGSIPEVAGDAALLVPTDDTGALAAALERALTDQAKP
jgi:glycosyltransferase involved in cell wall biosynthesis